VFNRNCRRQRLSDPCTQDTYRLSVARRAHPRVVPRSLLAPGMVECRWSSAPPEVRFCAISPGQLATSRLFRRACWGDHPEGKCAFRSSTARRCPRPHAAGCDDAVKTALTISACETRMIWSSASPPIRIDSRAHSSHSRGGDLGRHDTSRTTKSSLIARLPVCVLTQRSPLALRA